MTTKQYFRNLLYSFLLLFGLLCISGILLLFSSLPLHPTMQSPTNAKATFEGSKLAFELSTGIPGIVLVFLGMLGLLTLLLKIPVSRVVEGIDPDSKKKINHTSVEDHLSSFNLLSTLSHQNYETFQLPILLYFMLKRRFSLNRTKI